MKLCLLAGANRPTFFVTLESTSLGLSWPHNNDSWHRVDSLSHGELHQWPAHVDCALRKLCLADRGEAALTAGHWAPPLWSDLHMTLNGLWQICTSFYSSHTASNAIIWKIPKNPKYFFLNKNWLMKYAHNNTQDLYIFSSWSVDSFLVFAGYDLFVCSNQVRSKPTQRQQLTSAEVSRKTNSV